jgi:hypothetical protein
MEMLSKGTHPLEALVMDLEVQETLHTHMAVAEEELVALVELEQMAQVVAMEELAVKIVLMEQTFTGLAAAEAAVGAHLEALEVLAVAVAGQVVLLALEALV